MAGGIREGSGDDLDVNHEINVTPFIDVMLVLLIIFMVAAPLATVDVPVDLPNSTAQAKERPDDPMYLSVTKDLSLLLNDSDVTRAGLQAALDAKTGGDRQARVFLRADQAVAYGELMKVMNLLQQAGYLKVALVGLEQLSAEPTAAPAAGAAP